MFAKPSIRHQRARRAFTLMEMLLSGVILSLIFLGMQSAILLASRAAPDRSGGSSVLIRSGAAIDGLSADLAYATSILSSSATSITFTVADRTGDGAPDTIGYSWSGSAGAPLLRTLNGGTAVPVSSNVRDFKLDYQKRAQLRATTYSESNEILLSSNDGIGLLNLGVGEIDSTESYGQHLSPSLPAAAARWRITRVKFRARTHGPANGTTLVQIRKGASGGKPGAMLEERTMLESGLSSSFQWKEFTFSDLTTVPAGSGLCLVLNWVSDAHSCDVEYQALLALAPNTHLVYSSNGEQSWSVNSGQDMIHYIYGTYSSPNPAAYDYFLSGVECTLRSGSDPRSGARTTIRLVNQPTVSGP